MGKHYDSLMSALTGKPLHTTTSNGNGSSKHGYGKITPDMRELGRQARKDGMFVFISKENLDKLETLLGERPSKRFMRMLMERIACGELKLIEGSLHNATTGTTLNNGGAAVYTIKQAAKALGVKYQVVYNRAAANRIVTTRVGNRYLINQHEIDRLQRVGL